MAAGPRARQHVGYVPAETNFYDDMTVEKLLEWLSRFHGGGHERRRRELVDTFGVDLHARAVDLLQMRRIGKTAGRFFRREQCDQSNDQARRTDHDKRNAPARDL